MKRYLWIYLYLSMLLVTLAIPAVYLLIQHYRTKSISSGILNPVDNCTALANTFFFPAGGDLSKGAQGDWSNILWFFYLARMCADGGGIALLVEKDSSP